MARNRVIYQSEALYVSSGHNSTGIFDHAQLNRVQSANYNFSIARQDINQYGQLSRIDTLVMDPPTVNFDLSYYLTDGFNERALGFLVQNASSATSGNFASGHMTASSGKNLYILTNAEGFDAVRNTGNSATSVIGVGNAFLSNYSLELAVGSLPTVSVSFEGANINANSSISYNTGYAINGLVATGWSGVVIPSINTINGANLSLTGALPFASTNSSGQTLTALRPGDIVMDISAFQPSGIASLATTADGVHIQSASLSLPLSRSPLQRLGSKFPFARTVNFPVKATLSVKAIVNEISAVNLADIIKTTNEKDISITLKQEDGSTDAIKIFLRGCTLDSESFSSSIGSNKSVDLTFSTQIGGPRDLDRGILMSGINSAAVFGNP
jgi:hypothetical protein